MSANDRIFYACQAVAIQIFEDSSTLAETDMVYGLQSVGITTNFNLDQAFELGQIEIYENIEGTPDVEVTLEKVLDGSPLIYHMATAGHAGSDKGLDGTLAGSGLAGRSKSRSDVRLGIFPDNQNNVSTAGTNAEMEALCQGMYVSSISYTLPVDGSATESVTLVGNNKKWLRGTSATKMKAAAVDRFDGADFPAAIAGDPGESIYTSGGVTQREDVILSHCILPRAIQGVVGTGYANAWNATTKEPRIHIQNISVSTDFSREDIMELGRKTPYARPATFPIEVSCEIEAITTSGDLVFAYEHGDPNLYTTTASGNNTQSENIFVYTRGGVAFDLGDQNRLASVTYGGGDAAGGNVSCTYSYTNFNDLDVQMRQWDHYDGGTGYVGFRRLQGISDFPAGI